MSEWKEYKLGDVITLHYGKSLPERKRVYGNVPVYSSAGITGWHNKALINSKGLIIGRKGTIGKVYKAEEPFFPIDTCYYILPDEKRYCFDFLYYLLLDMKLEELNEDSAVPGLNRETAYSQSINLPPLPEQRAIASVLSSLDDKIELLHRQNKTLEAMAETLFRQWFVEEAGEEWEERCLGDILTVKGGSTPSTKNPEYWGGNIHWTTPRDLSNATSIYLLNTSRTITEKGLEKISSGLLPEGTLLLSSRAPVGYLAFSNMPISINQGYIAILDNKRFSKHWIYLWLKENMDYVKSHANGSTFQEISKSSFRSLLVTLPPEDLRNKFDSIISPVFDKIRKNTLQIRTLENLRDTLLPKLMSGEVRVRMS